MPAEVKFTSWGIPYLVEFANVSIRSPSSSKLKLRNKSSKILQPSDPCPTCGHCPKNALSIKDLNVDDARSDDTASQPGGLYLQFPARRTGAQRKSSANRLARLRWEIANAVTQVGMSSPPSSEVASSLDSTITGDQEKSLHKPPPSLFKGTYGQVKEALANAGLVVTPCEESGVEFGTRLGTLFISNSRGKGGVAFDKLTLWG